MTQKTLVQISDLHLSRTHAYTYPNWQAVVTYINDTQPDLVVLTGDYVLNTPEDTDDLVFVREQLNHLTVPWKALPGDHDIGGGPPQPRLRSEVPWLEHYFVTQERRAAYLSLFDEDHWALPFGDWHFIGLNDLIFASGFAAEADQWAFLERQLVLAQERPVALFMHKPPCAMSFSESDVITNAIPVEGRRRLWQMIQRANPRLIVSGHLHVYRTLVADGITVVSAPTLMRGKDDYRSHNGLPVNGIVEYHFEGAGVEFRLIQPPGIRLLNLPGDGRHHWPALPVERTEDD